MPMGQLGGEGERGFGIGDQTRAGTVVGPRVKSRSLGLGSCLSQSSESEKRKVRRLSLQKQQFCQSLGEKPLKDPVIVSANLPGKDQRNLANAKLPGGNSFTFADLELGEITGGFSHALLGKIKAKTLPPLHHKDETMKMKTYSEGAYSVTASLQLLKPFTVLF